MNKKELNMIISKIEKEDEIFADKSLLSTLALPEAIIGRQKQAAEIVRCLLGYKKGFIVPLISVYGRSGSGKSTVTRFICKNLKDISYCFVNLRKAKTIFGAANLILEELDQMPIKNAQGLGESINKVNKAIASKLEKENKNVFVLILDEIDVLFYDKRGNPSDFFYKLIYLEEKLREKNYLMSVITISNFLIGDYELDERVRSRIGNSEVFFEPYSKADIIKILGDRIKKALSKKLDDSVIEYTAKISSDQHGDARRAIDLLRVAAQIAGSKHEEITPSHVDSASEELQKDRIKKTLSSVSYHLKLTCSCLARLEYLKESPWHATSAIFNQYNRLIASDIKPLTYRRISELLNDLENSGLVISQTLSSGRHGYGKQYRLHVSPVIIGSTCFPDWWKNIEKRKYKHTQDMIEMRHWENPKGKRSGLAQVLSESEEKIWDNYVG